jgi:tetratricopeptide (TPR) repeat protein
MLRERLSNDFSSDELHVVPTTDVAANLESAGFSIDEPLATNDERLLANLLRSDLYVTGVISRAANGGYHLESRLVMPIDLTLVQPLPALNKKDLGDFMEPVSRSIKAAIKQLPGNRKCIAGLASKNFVSAIAGARAAIAAYPHALIARLCMAKAFFAQYVTATSHADSMGYADSVLTVSAVILQDDSLSVPILQYKAALFNFLNDTTRERQSLLNLVRADPNNTQLIEQVVNSLAARGKAQEAIPLVRDLMDKSPGNAHILDLAFKVYIAANDWQSTVNIGSELVKVDPAAADSSYFVRMANAYDQINQHQQAIDLLEQATKKLPNSALLWWAYAEELRKGGGGGTQRAADALRRVIALNSQFISVAYNRLISFYDTTNVRDSVYVIAQRAAQIAAVDKRVVANLVLNQGIKIFTAMSNGGQALDSAARANLQNVIKFSQLSLQIAPSVDAQYFIGAANFQIMQSAAGEADKTKSCQLAQLAQRSYQNVSVAVQSLATSGNANYKQQTEMISGYLAKYLPAIESQIKQFCK